MTNWKSAIRPEDLSIVAIVYYNGFPGPFRQMSLAEINKDPEWDKKYYWRANGIFIKRREYATN